MSFWSKFFIALAITILATTGAVVGVFAGQKEQIDMGGSIKYTVPYFTVTFLNYDDTVFDTQQVAYGHDATKPATDPTRPGYTFKSWTDYTNITQNRNVTANWIKNEAYLTTGSKWQAIVNASAVGSQTNIEQIEFVSSVPSGATLIGSVGVTNETATTVWTEGCGIFDVKAYYTALSTGKYKISFYSPYTICAPKDSNCLFSNSTSANRLTNLTSISFGNFNTSKVTDMHWMFYECSSLTSLNVSNFDTSNVTNMSVMFEGCSKLTSLNVSNFDTSKVTKMNSIFSGCSKLTSLNVSNFDTSKVTKMGRMFWGCSSLTSLNVLSFNTSNVTDMGLMFSDCSSLTSLNVSNFDTSKVTDMYRMFDGCSSLTSLNVSNFDTSNVTNMGVMFSDCSSLTSLNLSNFDTSKVTDMEWMFLDCSSLTSLNVSSFNTSNVTDMRLMFRNCSSLTSLNVSNFDTSKVTDMSDMFNVCSKLTSLNVSNFNTSNVTDMDWMFASCYKLTSLDLSSFDMSKVTKTDWMLSGCSALTEIKTPKAIGSTAIALPTKTNYSWFDQANTNNTYTQITSACTSKTLVLHENYSYLRRDWKTALTNNNANFKKENIKTIQFVKSVPSGSGYTQVSVGATTSAGTPAFVSGTAGVVNITAYVKANSSDSTKYDVIFYSPVTIYAPVNLSYLFSELTTLSSINFGNFNTSNVTNMAYMFWGCTILTTLNVSNFNTSNVTDMSYMFCCDSLTSLNLSNFDTSKVTNMEFMFSGCNITSLNVSNFNTSKVTNMGYMFYDCSKLTSLNLSNFNTSNVTNMGNMFIFCASLTSLNVSSFNTSKVTGMNSMFSGCEKLTSLDLSNFNTSNVTDMNAMFYVCRVLTSLNLSNFNTSKVTDMRRMFSGCSKLTSLNLSSFDMSKVTNTTDMLSYCSGLTEIKTPKAIGSTAVALPTKTGYSWVDQANTNNAYTQITSACLSKTLVLQGNKFTVTANANSGTIPTTTGWTVASGGATATKQVTYDSTYGTLPTPTRTGYTFNGWFTAQTGGSQIKTDTKVTITANQTIYARWTANKYHVTYSPNGGTGNNYVVEVTYGQPFVCLDNTDSHIGFTKKGHSFSHWIGNDGSNWNGWVGKPWTWAYAYDVIMNAQWSPNTYTVKYDANGGSGTMSDTTVKFGENITISTNTYTRVGYTYDRWLEQYPDGLRDNGWTGWSGQWRWDDGDYSITNRTLTLYASWTLNESYLRKDWQTALTNNNANFKQTNIKTIQFVKSVPSGSGYTQVSVGATTSAGTTAYASGTAGVSDVIAYVKANSSDSSKYDVIFYSPVTIYAPIDSSYLFSNSTFDSTYSNTLKNLVSISFGNFNTSKVTNMSGMFDYCISLTSLNVSSFNTGNVTDMSDMFRCCRLLTSLNLSNFNTSKVTNMRNMFYQCNSLTSLNVSSFDTSKVTDMSHMFNCSSLTSLNVSNFNTSNVTSMYYMFEGCSSLTSLNVSNFDTSNVTDMSDMFFICSSLTSLNLSNFNTSKVTDMRSMFRSCDKLTSLNVSNFNTSNVTNMKYMFRNCYKLTTLNLSSFDMSKVTDTTNMFQDCSALTTIYTPKTMGSTTVSLPGTSDSLHAWYKSTDSNRDTPYTTLSSSNTSSTITLRPIMRTITITWGSDSNGNGDWNFNAQWNGSVQVSSSQGGTQSGTRRFRVEATTSISCSFWIQSPAGLIWHKTGSVSISGTCTNSNFGSNTAGVSKGTASRTANASNFKSDITISFYFSASK